MTKKLSAVLIMIVWALGCAAQTDSLLPYPIDTIKGKAFYRYKVEKSIGLYRISVNFGVTQDDIIRCNPELRERGLHFEETILIPVNAKTPVVVATTTAAATTTIATTVATTAAVATEPVMTTDTLSVEEPQETPINYSVEVPTISPIQLSFLLPFQAEQIKREANMDRFYDFYTGALLAIYEAQSKGMHIRVHTYDIGKTDTRLTQALAQPALRQSDVIIGPAYGNQVAQVADMIQRDSIYMLVPFSSSIPDIAHNPYIIQFNPSPEQEAECIASYLAQRRDSVNCVLIEAADKDIPESVRLLRQALLRHDVPCTYTNIRALLADTFQSAIRDSVRNILIMNTERYSNLHAIMPNLLLHASEYRLTLMSHYSWQKEKILLPQLYATVFTTDTLADEGEYMQLFRQYFGHELAVQYPRYDLLGYDLTHHILSLLHEGGRRAIHPEQMRIPYTGLQSYISYHRLSPDGGYRNTAIHIVDIP